MAAAAAAAACLTCPRAPQPLCDLVGAVRCDYDTVRLPCCDALMCAWCCEDAEQRGLQRCPACYNTWGPGDVGTALRAWTCDWVVHNAPRVAADVASASGGDTGGTDVGRRLRAEFDAIQAKCQQQRRKEGSLRDGQLVAAKHAAEDAWHEHLAQQYLDMYATSVRRLGLEDALCRRAPYLADVVGRCGVHGDVAATLVLVASWM